MAVAAVKRDISCGFGEVGNKAMNILATALGVDENPPTADGRHSRELRAIRSCMVVVTIIAGVAACIAARDILLPMAIAIVLALVLAPIAHGLERLKIPSGLSAIFTMILFAALLAGAVATLAPAVADWIERMPDVARSAELKLRPFKLQLQAVQNVSAQIQSITEVGARPTPKPFVVDEAPLSSILHTAPDLFAKCVFVTILTIFILAFRKSYRERMIMLPRSFHNRIRVARVMRDVRRNVSGYLFVLVCINIGLAIVTTLAFAAVHIPDALLWGFAFGVANFIPVIGPTTVILASAFVGFATSNAIVDALAPPAILLAINTVEANLVQPLLLSRRIVVTPVAIFLSVAGFAWMWGATATIVAIPTLILFFTVARHFPALRGIAHLLTTDDAALDSASERQPTLIWLKFPRMPGSRVAAAK